MSGINRERGRIMFDTALRVLERDTSSCWAGRRCARIPKPYLGRSSHYPEGVRENGMYCHGVQWLIGAARLLAGQFAADGIFRRRNFTATHDPPVAKNRAGFARYA